MYYTQKIHFIMVHINCYLYIVVVHINDGNVCITSCSHFIGCKSFTNMFQNCCENNAREDIEVGWSLEQFNGQVKTFLFCSIQLYRLVYSFKCLGHIQSKMHILWVSIFKRNISNYSKYFCTTDSLNHFVKFHRFGPLCLTECLT